MEGRAPPAVRAHGDDRTDFDTGLSSSNSRVVSSRCRGATTGLLLLCLLVLLLEQITLLLLMYVREQEKRCDFCHVREVPKHAN